MKKIIIVILMALCITGCSFNRKDDTINIGVLKGPTGLGMLKVMDDFKDSDKYNVKIYTDPNLAANGLLSGEIDIASLPTNMASILYNKSGSGVRMLTLNTLSNLYILSDLDDINSILDIKGKTIYATGNGAVPQYVLEYILLNNGIDYDKDIKIEYKSEHSELASLAILSDVHIAMLPEPFVSNVLEKNPSMKIVTNINDEWNRVTNGESLLSMGCLATTVDFLENHKSEINNFLDEYKDSVEYVNNNIFEAAILSEKYEVMGRDVAKRAIPNCNIVFIDGEDMQNKTQDFLKILFSLNKNSIGGAIPDETFYYKR